MDVVRIGAERGLERAARVALVAGAHQMRAEIGLRARVLAIDGDAARTCSTASSKR